MTEILNRLDKSAAGSDTWRTPGCVVCADAKTEIERLRAALEEIKELETTRMCESDGGAMGEMETLHGPCAMIAIEALKP